MTSSTATKTRKPRVRKIKDRYDPLVELAEDETYALELLEELLGACYPAVSYIECRGRQYLIRGQIERLWGTPANSFNVYLDRHKEVFEELGMISVDNSFIVAPPSTEEWKIDAAIARRKRVRLFSPRCVAFLGFIYETPDTLKFQAKLKLPVPITLPTALKYAGLTN